MLRFWVSLAPRRVRGRGLFLDFPLLIFSFNIISCEPLSVKNSAISTIIMAATSENVIRRSSTETDRRHLLAESVCPSEASSMINVETGDGERTPRAQSPLSTFRVSQPKPQETTGDPSLQTYKGFPSKAHYLAALNAWAESKRYLEPSDSTIPGYYGQTTMEDYAQRPRIEFGISSWKRQRKEKRDAKRRSVA